VEIDAEVRGRIALQQKLSQVVADLHGPPILNAMRDCTLVVQRKAKINAPVDVGRLRASITPEVTIAPLGNTIQGVVGSNVEYAPAMEFGAPPHWPPLSDLEPWARRHGMSAFVVARAIARRGIKGRKYLQNALESSHDYIVGRLGRAVKTIVQK